MATPFQERSPCQTASYPRSRRAFAGKEACSALSSCRLTTSGSALDSQVRRLSSRLLMLLMLKVASFIKSLSVLKKYVTSTFRRGPFGEPDGSGEKVWLPSRYAT